MSAWVALLALATVALRLPFLGREMYPDEGGLLLVAHRWTTGGPELYGSLFVDRPPLLLAVFRVADAAGGLLALRLLGLVLAGLAVVLAARVGWLVGGRRAALMSAVVAAALLSNPMLGGHEVNAELVGLPLVLAGAAAALTARPGSRHDRRWLVLAGLAAGAAPLVKQNLLDGLVFAAIVVAGAGWRRGPRVWSARVGWLLVGAVVPVCATVACAAAGPGVPALWRAVVSFRMSAAQVIASTDSPANEHRAVLLAEISLLSGAVLLVLVAVWLLRHHLRDRVLVAAGAMLVVEVAGVVGGGSYWDHYLLATIPGVALLASRATAYAGRRLLTGAVAVAAASAVVAASVSTVREESSPPRGATAVAAWLDGARQPGDSGLVVYGQPELLRLSGLRPAYPYLWSLPTRVLDPRLHRLTRRIDAPSGPDWVLLDTSLNTWSLDPDGRAQHALTRHYREVASMCAWSVYLRRGEQRALPTPVRDC